MLDFFLPSSIYFFKDFHISMSLFFFPLPSSMCNFYTNKFGFWQLCLNSDRWARMRIFVYPRLTSEAIKEFDVNYCRELAYCILSAALSTASSFRIWNSSTGILSLPGASVRNSAHDKGHEERGLAYAKAGLSLRSPPGNSRASTPKIRVCLLSTLCSHLHLWL